MLYSLLKIDLRNFISVANSPLYKIIILPPLLLRRNILDIFAKKSEKHPPQQCADNWLASRISSRWESLNGLKIPACWWQFRQIGYEKTKRARLTRFLEKKRIQKFVSSKKLKILLWRMMTIFWSKNRNVNNSNCNFSNTENQKC